MTAEEKAELEFRIEDYEQKISSAKYWLEIASNPITIRNRKNEIKIYKKKIEELKQALSSL